MPTPGRRLANSAPLHHKHNDRPAGATSTGRPGGLLSIHVPNFERHTMQGISKLTMSALAALALCSALSATAADLAAVEARARAHIEAFPGHSMHAAGHTYAVRDIIVDAEGSTHVRFDRQVNGLRVIGGDLVVHSDAHGHFDSVSRTLEHLVQVGSVPRVGHAAAAAAALAHQAGFQHDGKKAELVVWARGDQPALAWEVRVLGRQADGTPQDQRVIVDAHSGQVLERWDTIHTASASGTGNGFYVGNVPLTTNSISGGYELRDPSRGSQKTVDMKNGTSGSGSIFTDSDNAWGTGLLSSRATVGVDAQYGTAVTWDYYKNVHGRLGIDGAGTGATNRVHYSSAYNNAYWDDSCYCMTYGDGDGTTFNPFDSLDVAGHEMTHGVTSRTANLVYSGQSGGLNEATSDIFGTAVEFYAANSKDAGDYLIGEKLYKTSGNYLRSMIQPSKDGASADCYYSTVGNLDVHYSSGVANHFFYLLSEGSAANAYSSTGSKTCGSSDTRVASGGPVVTGIGRAKAEKIWYRALTVYMTSSSKYTNARAATLSAAAYLYGSGSAEYNAVAAAWTAVKVS